MFKLGVKTQDATIFRVWSITQSCIKTYEYVKKGKGDALTKMKNKREAVKRCRRKLTCSEGVVEAKGVAYGQHLLPYAHLTRIPYLHRL